MNSEIQYPAAKAASAWCAYGVTACFNTIGINNWADASAAAQTIAGILAGFYTMILITEWFWKKFWRPIFVAYGWMKPAILARGGDDA